MKDHVRIAELKSRLSEYLRRVRRGRTLTVYDRTTPIARIVPIEKHARLTIRAADAAAGRLAEVHLPRPLDVDIDVVELLAEERGDR